MRVPPAAEPRLLPANTWQTILIRCLFLLAVALVLTLSVLALGART